MALRPVAAQAGRREVFGEVEVVRRQPDVPSHGR
jgi:hypothetical protein